MIHSLQKRLSAARRGVVLGLVLFVGVIVLLVGLGMISQSRGLLLGGVDSKQRIKSHIAAETQATLQIAAAMEKASLLYGSDLTLPGTSLQALPTGDGLRGVSEVTQTGVDDGNLPQELITTGQYKGLKGLKLSYLVEATGYAPGGAKSTVEVELKIYQIPIFQFGVFYQGNLEITPGLDMNVMGPVHTNSSAFFRAPNWGVALRFQGPVTAAGKIYHWMQTSGAIKYRITPANSVDTVQPSLGGTITEATASSVPPEVNKTRNVSWNVDPLKLPIETDNPHDILLPSNPSDPVGLSRQKFANKASAASSWINGGTGAGRPSWIRGNAANDSHRVFWDRRELKWVRYWDFDVAALIASGNTDSIFYIADTFNYGNDKGLRDSQTINAFRIVNAARLPRNMTIATPNPVYIVGNFNTQNTPGCYDQSSPPPPGGSYCNAMIASDAITLVSPKWTNYRRGNGAASGGGNCLERSGNLDQGAENPLWVMDSSSPEPMSGAPHSVATTSDPCGTFMGAITVNAALMTGNKSAPLAVLPPNNYSNDVFENGYEGGWHNTVRFLEDLSNAAVNLNGSFVCMWESSFRGLTVDPGVRVNRTLPGGFYRPPQRNWGFDPRFTDLRNMPPGTPFLASQPFTTWKERR